MIISSRIDIDDNELSRLCCLFACELARHPDTQRMMIPFGQEDQYVIMIERKTIDKIVSGLRKKGCSVDCWDLPADVLKKIKPP